MVLEHTVGALITRFASKYIDNLDLSALRLSVFGGDVVLRNLELNLEVLRRDFAAGLPIEFQRGYVREIRIHIPWLKLASEPIELTIDTVELVASLLPPDTASGCPEETAVSSGASTEAPAELGGGSASTDGWMGPLLTKALFNMSVVVRNVVVKFVEERAVASLSLRSIEVHSAGAQWQRACVEPEGPSKRLRKTVTLSDLTLCLDEQEKGSSRVAHFQHPLLRRASLVARIDMHLQPAERPDGATTLLLDVLCPALELALSDTQLLLLGELLTAVEKLQRAIRAEAEAKAAAAAAAAEAEEEAPPAEAEAPSPPPGRRVSVVVRDGEVISTELLC